MSVMTGLAVLPAVAFAGLGRQHRGMQNPERLPAALRGLRIPLMAAPMFLVSGPELVIAQCKAGIIGSFPAANARGEDGDTARLEDWILRIGDALARHDAENPATRSAPFAVNMVVNKRNEKLEQQVEICARLKVPIWITSLGARADVNDAADAAGAIVLHDVISNTFARKAIEKGADGLIAVAAGAGGHAGPQSPFALVSEIRQWFQGPLLLSGSIATGQGLLAAQVMGADMGYVGSPFIATDEANASDAYKEMIVASGAEEIIASRLFTGISGNYLRPSIASVGLNPDILLADDEAVKAFAAGPYKSRVWKEIWGSGHGIGSVTEIAPVARLVDRIVHEYEAARHAFAANLRRNVSTLLE